MKWISLLIVLFSLWLGGGVFAQDAATQERLDKLGGQIEDIIATQRAQQKQIEALAKEIESLREQAGKHNGNYASQEELKRVADALNEAERKRVEDSDRISKQLSKLGEKLTTPLPPPRRTQPSSAESSEKATEKGYSYVVQQGDTLSVIVQAYREKNVKVSTEQILKANPGLKPEKLKVGQKIWIPAPQS